MTHQHHRTLPIRQIIQCRQQSWIYVDGRLDGDMALRNAIGDELSRRGPPQQVEAPKSDRPEQPDPEGLAAAPEAGSGRNQFEKGLLNDILGRSPISQEAMGEREEVGGRVVVDGPVRIVRAAPDAVDPPVERMGRRRIRAGRSNRVMVGAGERRDDLPVR